MTLEELKEALSTYGANPEERSAPVVFTAIDGTTVPITAAVVDWDYTEGHVVLLSAVQS